MGIVAREARQLIIFLETLALAHVANLIGHVIFFLALVQAGPKIIVQRLTGSIAEGRAKASDCVAMTLTA